MSELAPAPPHDAPEALRAAWALVLQWAGGGDRAREDRLADAGAEDLAVLAAAVAPLYPAIRAYLDATGNAARAVPFGDLVQAGLQARFELARRASAWAGRWADSW